MTSPANPSQLLDASLASPGSNHSLRAAANASGPHQSISIPAPNTFPRTSTASIGSITSPLTSAGPLSNSMQSSSSAAHSALSSAPPITSGGMQASILPDYAVGFYVRVQLPSGDTTMIMSDENTTISEIIRGVELKKDITLDDWTVSVILPDNKKVDADSDQTMSNFKEIEKLVISGTIVMPHPLAPPTCSTGTRRGSILSTPSGKQTTVRVSSDVFPHTFTDQEESRSLRGSTKTKMKIKTAFSALFGKKNSAEHEHGSSTVASSTDSISHHSGPRSASSSHNPMSDSLHPSKQEHMRSVKHSVSSDINDCNTRHDNSGSQDVAHSNLTAGITFTSPSVSSFTSASVIANTSVAARLNASLQGSRNSSRVFDESYQQSPVATTFSPPSLSAIDSQLSAAASSLPASSFMSATPSSSMPPSGSSLPHGFKSPLNTSDNSTPTAVLAFEPVKEESPVSSQADGINILDTSMNKTCSTAPETPLNESQNSMLLMSPPRTARRRSQSQPMMRPIAYSTLRKSNYADRLRSSASNANGGTDSANGSTINVNGSTAGSANNVSGNGSAVSTVGPEIPKMHFIKMHYLDNTVAVLKLQGETTLEQLLSRICKRRSYDFETLTFEFTDKSLPAEMDRRIDFYAKDNHQIEMFIIKKSKVYSTICISEDGVDVMLMQVISGKTQVMAATVDKIFDMVTDARHHDDSFLDMVLLTFRSFMTPEAFLNQLISRFYCQMPPDPTQEDIDYFNSMKIPTQRRVIYVIQWWVDHHWHDFGLSTEYRRLLEGFLHEIAAYPDYSFEQESREIIKLAEKKREWFEDMLATYTLGERRVKKLDSMFDELDPQEMARQLCIYNHSLFKNIHPIEFLNEIWVKDNDGSPSFKFFVERFDRESYWVATELVQLKDIKKRTTALKKFINLVKESLDLNNFFSTFSLIAGLNLTPVQRLKKTWEALPEKSKKLWQEVEKVADPSKNMKNYRDRIAASMPPMVPFLPIYLKDLTFMNDGNQSKVRGMINVEKLRMMSKRVLEITSLARSKYPFESKPTVLNYLAKPRIETDMNKLKEAATEVENA